MKVTIEMLDNAGYPVQVFEEEIEKAEEIEKIREIMQTVLYLESLLKQVPRRHRSGC